MAPIPFAWVRVWTDSGEFGLGLTLVEKELAARLRPWGVR